MGDTTCCNNHSVRTWREYGGEKEPEPGQGYRRATLSGMHLFIVIFIQIFHVNCESATSLANMFSISLGNFTFLHNKIRSIWRDESVGVVILNQ